MTQSDSNPALPFLITRDGEAEADTIAPEKLIHGDPATRLWHAFSDPSEQFHVGHWSSGVCKLNVSYSEQELCVLLEGEAIVTDMAGNSRTFGKGEAFVIPAGFEGTWESTQPVVKIYAIFEAA